MNFEELATFLTLCEVKNFTQTAEKLSMSQPTVSLHIKNLENEFQTKLFHRSSKKQSITPTGEILYERAKQIMQIYERTKQQIAAHHHTIQGELKIGASYTIGEYILPMILAQLKKQHSNLTLQIHIGNTKEIVNYVKLLQVDIGLIEGTTNDKELRVTPFMEDELFIVCSPTHRLARMKSVSISDLQNEEWIIRETGSGTGEYLHHVLNQHGLKVRSLTTISSTQGIKESVIHNLGISLLSKNTIKRELQLDILHKIPLQNEQFIRTFSSVYSPIMEERLNVQALLNELSAMEKEI